MPLAEKTKLFKDVSDHLLKTTVAVELAKYVKPEDRLKDQPEPEPEIPLSEKIKHFKDVPSFLLRPTEAYEHSKYVKPGDREVFLYYIQFSCVK